jgi:hypothetical protein
MRRSEMGLPEKRKADRDHLAAHSLKLRGESQALIKKLRDLREEGLELRAYSKSIRDSLEVFRDSLQVFMDKHPRLKGSRSRRGY